MTVSALSYVRLPASELGDWEHFGTTVLGLHLAEAGRGALSFRMDERPERVVVDSMSRVAVLGWEATSPTQLQQIASSLDNAGFRVRPMSRAEQDQRRVAQGLVTQDPDGNTVEIACGFATEDLAFSPGRTISGFRTGDLGLGHVVLTSPRASAMVEFYRTHLGFGLSDYVKEPFEAFFMHVNARHHSLAVIQANVSQIHHVMLEFNSLDDVGQGYDLIQAHEDQIGVTLGRHSNDHMLSFYAKSPTGHMVECGWGGLSIDPQTWCPVELVDGPSLWGHDRKWLGDQERAKVRGMQVAAAARGVRQRVHVWGDNYDVS